MARQLGCDLTETIYVLDEPTAGLHPKDVDRVIENLKRLRDGGNTVLVVEHDPEVIKSSDYICTDPDILDTYKETNLL